MIAVKLMLDIIHPSLPIPSMDQNIYILRNIGDYNIVVTYLPVDVYDTISTVTVTI
jgi:hypothetical protein